MKKILFLSVLMSGLGYAAPIQFIQSRSTRQPGNPVINISSGTIDTINNSTFTNTTINNQTLNSVNARIGSSGTAGTLRIYPASASKGSTLFTAQNNTNDSTTTITTALQAAARTYTVTDVGASTANFVMSAGGGQFDNGTQAIPGIGYIQDTGTGFRKSATGTQEAVASGVDVASFTTTGSFLKGTTTNNDAATGWVGEYLSSGTALTGAGSDYVSFPTSGNYADLGAIALTAGDWDLNFRICTRANGGTVTMVQTGFSTANGNATTGMIEGNNTLDLLPPTSGSDNCGALAGYRVSTTGTTIHLKYEAVYTVATPKAAGIMVARRVR